MYSDVIAQKLPLSISLEQFIALSTKIFFSHRIPTGGLIGSFHRVPGRGQYALTIITSAGYPQGVYINAVILLRPLSLSLLAVQCVDPS